MTKIIDVAAIKSGVLIGAPVPVTVPILVGVEECEFHTHIKPFSYATVISRWRAIGEEKEQLAGALASCICDADGDLEFTEDDIRQNFSEALIEALWGKIVEINKIGGKSQTKSSAKANSLRKSSSPASQKRSKKQKTSRVPTSPTGESTSPDVEASTSGDESNKQSGG